MRALLFLVALLAAQCARAAEGLPFPNLDTEGYCTALVSKMLVKAEQQVEKQKCLVEENALRAATHPYWYLVSADQARYLNEKYLTEVRFLTYLTVSQFVASAIGKACLEERIFCAPDKTTVELSAFKKAGYCSSADCVKDETARRLRLEKYLGSLPKAKVGWCLGLAFNQKLLPLQMLSGCVAEDIGQQCLYRSRQCRPG
ncbi:MAG: hypothetical protein EOS63_16510 [Mesorhizobium sp.]|uniref:hypothetical protein n=1 Tax=Mesorhizobium sp. TaxID=1871066 RepID=UPI000FE5D3D6|nr:hypothetical protein [Mesorhizobium sp.]RWE79012.1 MAG: hypothetical protein EOS63_16510 [Mesorhizobium sp.]TIT11758.1 MAG: hypothetical protein E5W74_12050 [Mesorhizobium sp.]TJW63381.1 MAG: hypothetical protein E5V97_12780 [Mesorhizobium sp.]